MRQNILLSKIVPNSTETCWSQAYSTLNLFVIVTIEKQQETSLNIASVGKVLLEKIQREFFALDEKNLKNIKEAVNRSFDELNPAFSYSLVLSTINQDVLSVVIVNSGFVIIKREDKIGRVAKGETGKIVLFSGNIKPNDIILLETKTFSDKISVSKLKAAFEEGATIFEMCESLAPLIHEGSLGNEAAILLMNQKTEDLHEPINEIEQEEPPLSGLSKRFSFKAIKDYLLLRLFTKKIILAAVVIALICTLSIGLFFERRERENESLNKKLNSVFKSSKIKYDEAVALSTLNKNIAIGNLLSAKNMLVQEINSFPDKSSQKEKLNDLISRIDKKLEELGGNALIPSTTVIFDGNQTNFLIGALTAKGGNISIVSENNGSVVFFKDEKITDSIKTNVAHVLGVTADQDNLYILSKDGVYRMQISGSQVDQIIEFEKTFKEGAVDTFGGNIYVLNTSDSTVEKYQATDYIKSSYFTEETIFQSQPISMTIDGAVWILNKDATILKFTKGKKDEFVTSGIITPFDSNGVIYTDIDYESLYILNKSSKTIAVVTKKGEYSKSYSFKDVDGIEYFSVDERNKKGYVANSKTVYSFDL